MRRWRSLIAPEDWRPNEGGDSCLTIWKPCPGSKSMFVLSRGGGEEGGCMMLGARENSVCLGVCIPEYICMVRREGPCSTPRHRHRCLNERWMYGKWSCKARCYRLRWCLCVSEHG